jgi:hypothetical protein
MNFARCPHLDCQAIVAIPAGATPDDLMVCHCSRRIRARSRYAEKPATVAAVVLERKANAATA